MLITLSRRAAICQSVAEVQLTGLAPLGAVSHRFFFIIIIIIMLLHQQVSRLQYDDFELEIVRICNLDLPKFVVRLKKTPRKSLIKKLKPRQGIRCARSTDATPIPRRWSNNIRMSHVVHFQIPGSRGGKLSEQIRLYSMENAKEI